MTTPSKIDIDPATAKRIESWLNGSYNETTKAKIRQLQQTQPEALVDAFYTHLEFGTGGMRGIMGVGTNRMNVYTVRAATQGLANYVNKQPKPPQGHSAFISYDSRNNSKDFAEETAKVLAGNGIKVYLTKYLRPTPYVSFGCRHFGCTTAVMITASHNPPQYNGYKVYWNDGGQVLPPHDTGIVEEVAKITEDRQVKAVAKLEHSLIQIINLDFDDTYLEAITKQQCYPEKDHVNGNNLSILYTSLYGTGITVTPNLLRKWGFKNLSFVEVQCEFDTNFATAPSPNPENLAAMRLGIEQMLATNADILIANDPDADRVGVAIRVGNRAALLNGNQVAVLCLVHICEALTTQKTMPEKPAFIKTIVTTELFREICTRYRAACYDVLPGFKYIAEKIRDWENTPGSEQFVFGGEESCGYLKGTQTRDKDAVLMSGIVAEVALLAKMQGKTLLDKLNDIYHTYGAYYETLKTVEFQDTKIGREAREAGMKRLSENHPRTIGGAEVVAFEDLTKRIKIDYLTQEKTPSDLPVSEVLRFWLKDGSILTVRPSGTEPKIKLYAGIKTGERRETTQALEQAQVQANAYLEDLEKLLR